METSVCGQKMIKGFECKGAKPNLKAYKCPAGKLTIGYGHTSGVKENDIITLEEAEQLFQKDLVIFENSINRLVLVALTQNQYDSLVSFVFNIGEGKFKKSTLLRKLNAKDYIGAAEEFPKWVYSKGKKLNGLVARRDAEKALFLKN